MDRSSLAQHPDGCETPDDNRADEHVAAEASQDRLRARLLAVAEDEAAAIVEDARREILVTVRRARRDLLMVRAQLQRCSLEPPDLAGTELEASRHEHVAISPSLDDEVPLDAVVVRHTNALRLVVGQAATDLHVLSAPGFAVPPIDELQLSGLAGAPPFPTVSGRALIIAAIVALSVVAGMGVWMYGGRSTRSVASGQPRTEAATHEAIRDRNAAPGPTTPGPVKHVALEPRGSTAPSSRVTLPTTRPVTAAKPAQDAKPLQLTPAAAPASIGTIGSVTPSRSAIVQVANQPPPANAPVSAAVNPDQRTEGRSPAATGDSEPQAAIFAKHVRWFDAYGRGDRQVMAGLTTAGFSVRDERGGRPGNADAGASTPPQLSDVHIEVAGAGAVLTGRLRSSINGVPGDSFLSEVWIRGEQQEWALMGVRITPVDRVPPPAR